MVAAWIFKVNGQLHSFSNMFNRKGKVKTPDGVIVRWSYQSVPRH